MPTPKIETLRKLMAQGVTLLIMGGRPDPLRPGAARGFFCIGCGAEVQLFPPGQAQVKEGGKVVCSPCGLALAEMAADAGSLDSVAVGDEAERDVAATKGKRRDQIELLKTRFPFNYPD